MAAHDAGPVQASGARDIGPVSFLSAGGVTHEIAGWVAGQSAVSGAVEITHEIAGTVAGQSAISGAVEVTREIAGASAGQSAASGAVEALREVSGAATAQAAAGGRAGLIRPAAGASAATAGVTGSVGAMRGAAGVAAGQSSVAGTASLTSEVLVSGSADGQSGVSGTIQALRQIGGATAAQSSALGAIETTREIAGATAGLSATQGSLTIGQELLVSGAAGAEASCIAGIEVLREIAGIAAGQSGLAGSATLTSEVLVSGSTAGQSAATGEIEAIWEIAGTAAGDGQSEGGVVVVWSVAGIAAGTATASGVIVFGPATLAGSVGAAGDMAGLLLRWVRHQPWQGGSLSYRRRWLREALFAGMTNDAYKLGTTLTLGWFWMRRNGCDAAFRRQAGETDRGLVRGVIEPGDSEISLTQADMAAGTRWEFSRVRIAGCGFESAESERCMVRIGDDGDMEPLAPNRPLGVEAEQLEGGAIELRWRYSDIDEEATPDGFNIYMDSGSGFDFSTPVDTVPYGVGGIGGEFSWTSDPLVDGQRYRFCVRSYTDAGGESHNADTAAAVADSQGPAAITGLLASWEEI